MFMDYSKASISFCAHSSSLEGATKLKLAPIYSSWDALSVATCMPIIDLITFCPEILLPLRSAFGTQLKKLHDFFFMFPQASLRQSW